MEQISGSRKDFKSSFVYGLCNIMQWMLLKAGFVSPTHNCMNNFVSEIFLPPMLYVMAHS